MAFDESLAGRIRDALARKKNIEEKKMFGCICFFLNGNALAGVWKDRLIARLGPKRRGSCPAEAACQSVRHHRLTPLRRIKVCGCRASQAAGVATGVRRTDGEGRVEIGPLILCGRRRRLTTGGS